MDYDKLPNPEIDVLVAERVMSLAKPELPLDWPGRGFMRDGWELIPVQHGGMQWMAPHYSTDDNAARLVRNRIAELNLRVEFEEALDFILKEPDGRTSRFVSRFTLHQATPRQQCIAALKALAGSDKEPRP